MRGDTWISDTLWNPDLPMMKTTYCSSGLMARACRLSFICVVGSFGTVTRKSYGIV